MRISSIAAAARVGIAVMFLLMQGHAAQAAEITLVSSLGMKVMLGDLIPDFERATGHKVTAVYGAPAPMKARAEAEPVDLVVLPVHFT